VEKSPVRCADGKAEKAILSAIDEAKKSGDSLGGVFEVIAGGVPIGLGSHVHWDRRLNGRIAQAMMSINAIKGVEIGAGFDEASLPGSQVQDIIELGARRSWRHPTNRAGGIEGGMSNGEPIIVRAAVKPIPTMSKPLPSVDLRTGEKVEAHFERSDICVVPAAGVIGEAMLAIVLAEAVLEKCGKTAADVDVYVPHQANVRIIDYAVKRLGIPEDRVIVNVDRYGNTSSGSIPLALADAAAQGFLRPGKLVLMTGMGTGLTWGSSLIEWTKEVAA